MAWVPVLRHRRRGDFHDTVEWLARWPWKLAASGYSCIRSRASRWRPYALRRGGESLPQIVLARLVQGLFGAALIPLSQAVLLDINPPARHARAMAVWVMGVTLGPIIGPALGGWLTENYNWRWVFYINVLPSGSSHSSAYLVPFPETTIRQSRFDFFGFTALS